MIVPITDIDIRLLPGAWPVPEFLRAQVPATWARLLAANPHLWDGRILGVSGLDGGPPAVIDGVLRGVAREDRYSAFLAWRELGFPEVGVRNLFGSAIIVSADGAILLGEMGADTANAGRIYAVGGTLEPADVQPDGRVDVAGSTVRELTEETGLDAGEARWGGCYVVFDGPRISVAQFFHFPTDALTLRERVRRNLERQAHRELADMAIVRGPGALPADRTMPYVEELLAAFARGEVG